MQDWYLIGNATMISGDEDTTFDYGMDSFEDMLNTIGVSVRIYDSNCVEYTDEKCIVSNRTSDNYKNCVVRNFIFPIGTITAGKYVYYKEKYWLVQSFVDDNGVYEKAICILAQINLKWQDEVSGNIIQIWGSVMSASESDDGLDSDNKTFIVNDRLIIKIPLSIIGEDLTGKRIFVNPSEKKVYKITSCDSVTYKYGSSGIAILYTERELYNADTDDLATGICDYRIPIPTDHVQDTYRIALSYKGTNLYVGVPKVITATLYDPNGNVVDAAIYNWTILNQVDTLTYDIDDDEITLVVSDEKIENITIKCQSLDCEDSVVLVVR